MLDACTGRICSMQRVAVIGTINDITTAGARFYEGPLGGHQGADNGSAKLMTVSDHLHPAATSVNDGARIGLRLIKIAGSSRDKDHSPEIVASVARFATKLWRTMNGDKSLPGQEGSCARNAALRGSLLAIWDWLYPMGCPAVSQVQSWQSHEGNQHYINIGAHHVMKMSEDEKKMAKVEDIAISDFKRIVDDQVERQTWRESMSAKAYERASRENTPDSTSLIKGIAVPLPLVSRDEAWRLGGWSTSAANQRRAKGDDGGVAISKVRLKVGGGGGD